MNKNDQRILAARKRWNFKAWIACATALLLAAEAAPANMGSTASSSTSADADRDAKQWIGTWATAAQPFLPKSLQTNHLYRPSVLLICLVGFVCLPYLLTV